MAERKPKNRNLFRLTLRAVVAACLINVVRIAGAAPQEVVPVTGTPFNGELVSIDDAGRATFRLSVAKDSASGTRVLALDQLVRWGNPRAVKPQPVVVLADGGLLVAAADWSGGVAVRLVGGDVVLMSDEWGEVRLARKLVSGIVFSLQSRPDDRERMIDSLDARASQLPSPAPSAAIGNAADDAKSDSTNGKSANADSVQLTNGDQLTGKLTELDRGSLTINSLVGDMKLPVSRVEVIRLAGEQHAGGAVEKAPAARMIVGTREGSMIYANAMRANEKGVEIDMACGVKLKGDALDEIVAIQSLTGPIVYLSDLDGANYRSVPYLSLAWPYRRNRNVLGHPIDVRGERYWKGIGMHSAARLTYPLDRPYTRFESAVAVDDSAEGRGSVTFAVYVERDGKWSEAFNSGVVRGGDAPLPVSVDLRSAKGLTLTVDFADHGDELDHAVWLDPRLVR